MKRLRAALLILCFLVLASVTGVLYWQAVPLETQFGTPDPAVLHANKLSPSASPFIDHYFEHNGHQIHFVEAGQGKPIIFIHGFPSFWYSFIRQADAFRDTHRVILLDGLGAGRSSATRDVRAYSLEDMTVHVFALMDSLGLQKAHFVGHDWGAGLVYALAQSHPERALTVTGISAPPQTVLLEMLSSGGQQSNASSYIETLKSANPFLLWTLDAPERIWAGAYEPLVAAGHLSEEEGRLFRGATSTLKRIDAHINWYRANIPAPDRISEVDFWPARNARLSMPHLFIWGTDDPTLTPDTLAAIEAVSDHFTHAPMDDVGHWPHLIKPDQVIQLIKSHMSNQ